MATPIEPPFKFDPSGPSSSASSSKPFNAQAMIRWPKVGPRRHLTKQRAEFAFKRHHLWGREIIL
jgi:hypothetical protein